MQNLPLCSSEQLGYPMGKRKKSPELGHLNCAQILGKHGKADKIHHTAKTKIPFGSELIMYSSPLPIYRGCVPRPLVHALKLR
jgi:hypothetical protein